MDFKHTCHNKMVCSYSYRYTKRERAEEEEEGEAPTVYLRNNDDYVTQNF